VTPGCEPSAAGNGSGSAARYADPVGSGLSQVRFGWLVVRDWT
jgi:hypothetical protein